MVVRLASAMQCLYGAARYSGNLVVISNSGPRRWGWAVLVVGVAALTLAGCGRKGGLDLPPTAASASTATTPPQDAQTAAASKPSVFDPSFGMNAPPSAAKGPKKAFILDPLLGN